MTDLPAYAALLRAAGWTVTEPAAAEIPRVEVGQVWRGQDEERHVTYTYVVSPGDRWIVFSDSIRGTDRCKAPNWNAWARKAGARPVEE